MRKKSMFWSVWLAALSLMFIFVILLAGTRQKDIASPSEASAFINAKMADYEANPCEDPLCQLWAVRNQK